MISRRARSLQSRALAAQTGTPRCQLREPARGLRCRTRDARRSARWSVVYGVGSPTARRYPRRARHERLDTQRCCARRAATHQRRRALSRLWRCVSPSRRASGRARSVFGKTRSHDTTLLAIDARSRTCSVHAQATACERWRRGWRSRARLGPDAKTDRHARDGMHILVVRAERPRGCRATTPAAQEHATRDAALCRTRITSEPARSGKSERGGSCDVERILHREGLPRDRRHVRNWPRRRRGARCARWDGCLRGS